MKQVYLLLILLFYTFFLHPLPACANEPEKEEYGTLILTYQTDSQGSRLDRIRFWIINDRNEKILYPKKNEVVTNHTTYERTVVTNLPIGNYTIQFLFPNSDNFFKSIEPKKMVITPRNVIKIDQVIEKHKVSTIKDELSALVSQQYPLTPLPPPLPLPHTPFGPDQAFRSVYPNLI